MELSTRHFVTPDCKYHGIHMELTLEGALVDELRAMMKKAAEQVEKRSEDRTWATIASELATATIIEHPHLNLQIAYMSYGTRKEGPRRPDATILDHQVELEIHSPLRSIVPG